MATEIMPAWECPAGDNIFQRATYPNGGQPLRIFVWLPVDLSSLLYLSFSSRRGQKGF